MTITETMNSRDLGTTVGSADGLFDALARIETEGWDRDSGRAVLDYALTKVVRPVVRTVGFTGTDAEYAESTGWAAAWEALRSPKLWSTESPWGVVNAAVRSAVLGERMAETYGTSTSSAWRVHRFQRAQSGAGTRVRGDWSSVADPSALARPLSLSAMIDAGFDPAEQTETVSATDQGLGSIVALLARHGWSSETARAAVLHVSEHARANPAGTPKAHGWREMAMELRIPPWQARRVTVLLLGAPGWPGLVERVATGGAAALAGPVIAAAVQATCDESMRPPARSARAVEARTVAVAS